jgi:hypothetical protein
VTDHGLELWWARGDVTDGQHERPRLTTVATVHIGTGIPS